MKTVYAVRGSEDGTIGIYSSKKKAIVRAREYVNQNDKIINEDLESDFVWFFYGSSLQSDVERWDVE